MTDEKELDKEEELTEEELAELTREYKRELAHVYRTASAKRALLIRRKTPGLEEILRQCDEDMRRDIEGLQRKYGIHY